MAIKFSEIEKLSERKLIIENGKPFWKENILSGEISFKVVDENLLRSINDEVLTKLSNETTDTESAYLLIPIFTDIENDITFDRFENMIRNRNDVALALFEGVIDLFDGIIEYSEKINKVQEKAQKLQDKLPQMDEKELKKQELNEIYNKFATITDNKERDELLKKAVQLKAEIGE
jgi:hypothetical protein